MKKMKYLFTILLVALPCWADENSTLDPFRFLDQAAVPTPEIPSVVLEEEQEEEELTNDNPIFQSTIRKRDVNAATVDSISDAVVIGTKRGTDVSDLVRSAFRNVFSEQQLQEIKKDILDTLERTRQTFKDSAFFINKETGELAAFASANDFLGNSRGEFGNSELVGNVIQVGEQNFRVVAARNFSPIIIDLDGNGKADVNRNEWLPHAPRFFGERTAIFDINGDGKPELMEWLGPKDGLLVLTEMDGSIQSGNNLFGTAGGYKDGYVKMSVTLDLDQNGWVEKDELLALSIWQDKNGNAKAEKEEIKDISEYGISRIAIKHKNFESVCFIKGKKVKTWDWWPAGFDLEEIK